jgi:predicted DNA-binding protein
MVKKTKAVRISERHIEELEKLAKKEGETVSFLIQQAIREYLERKAAQNQLQKFLRSDKGVALLASGYRASVNSLWSGRSWDSATKQEPIEETAQCAQSQ